MGRREARGEKAATRDLAARNKKKYLEDYVKWLAEGLLGFRLCKSDEQIPWIKPRFRLKEETGAFVRKDRYGGID